MGVVGRLRGEGVDGDRAVGGPVEAAVLQEEGEGLGGEADGGVEEATAGC